MIGALSEKRLGKLFYSLGSLGESLFFAIVATYLTFFYIDVVRLDPVLVGLGYTLTYGIWNSVNDVIAGYISDRTRTKWGRRIPYVLFFSPVLVVLFTLIWTPHVFSGVEPMAVFSYYLLTVFLFEFVYTLVDVGWNALFPEMYATIEDRSEVAVLRQVFATIGLVIAVVAAPQLLSMLTAQLGTQAGWAAFGATVGVIGGGSFLLSLLGSREKFASKLTSEAPIREYFVVTFTNRAFLAASLMIMSTSWMWSFLEAMTPFVVKHFLGGSVADITLVGAPMILFPIVSYPLWRKLILKHGYKAVLVATTVAISLDLTVICLLADSIAKAIVLTSAFGFFNGGVQVTRELLIPDVVDDDFKRTGLRKEGIYYGARTFVDRFSLALTGLSTALVFTVSGYVPGEEQQPLATVLAMRYSASAVLLLATLVFLAAAKLYPLGGKNKH